MRHLPVETLRSKVLAAYCRPVRDGDRELLAVDICSLTVLPSISLVQLATYPGIRSDHERSFSVMRRLPADIVLASHSSWFDLQCTFRERDGAADPAEPFIDRAGCLSFISRQEAAFRAALAKQQGGRQRSFGESAAPERSRSGRDQPLSGPSGRRQ